MSAPLARRPPAAAADVPALRCAGLVHVYREAGTDVAALRGIDLEVEPGQRVALLGPSGSGKSTLLTVVAGIMRPSAGTVAVFGTDLGNARERNLRRLRAGTLGLMLQGASTNLLLHEGAGANVEWALRGIPSGSTRVADQLLDAAGLRADDRPVREMSPAEQQMLALAVAMSTRPRLLLADEPTSQLDDADRDRLLDLLVEIADQQGTAVLLVTHDELVAARMQRSIHLRDGRIGEEATAAGRYAVIGADGSIPLPEALRAEWGSGRLVSIDAVAPGELRIRGAETGGDHD
ncbi:ABC transporter ATP-binding protein [Pseudolysinimonas kribbensis]|uniref:ABC transporter ATP-binding protein n=1 Tax=Pseudolysinimonas kribbensis TaxID=433641 RepID=UPI0031CF8581